MNLTRPTGRPAKRSVITLHGINSDGKWQEEVDEALGVLFDFKPIKYNHYRWFRGTELLFCPFVWPPLTALFVFALWRGWLHGICMTASAAILIFIISFLCSYPYRAWAEKVVRKRLSRQLVSAHPPDFIAHSFGTYLAGRSLCDIPSTSFARVVLTGCVLDVDFPWSTTGRFKAVRNEMAFRDRIVRLAARLDQFIPGFGAAGYLGFKGPVTWVHTVESPNSPCGTCWSSSPASVKQQAPIHNVKCEGLDHSDYFLGPAHAVVYWMPFLWGYDPALYRKFLTLCSQIERAGDEGRPADALADYYRVRQSPWGQFPGKILDQEIREFFQMGSKGHAGPSDEELDELATETLLFVLRGQHALEDKAFVERETWVRCLNPAIAIQYAHKKVRHA